MHGGRDSHDPVAKMLKRAAVAFERIFFSPVGLGDANWPLYRKAIAGFFGGTPAEASFLLDTPAFWNDVLLLPEDLDSEDAVYRSLHRSDDPLALRQVAEHLVMGVLPDRYFDAPLESRQGYKQRGSMIMELIEDAYFSARLKQWLSGAAGLLTPVQRRLQQLAADAGNVRLRRLDDVALSLTLDFANLSWQQIMGLRLSANWTAFLAKLDTWTELGSVPTDQAIAQDLFAVTGGLVPSRSSVLVATAANVLPPLGWALTAQAAHQRQSLERDEGWLLFMLEAKKRLGQ